MHLSIIICTYNGSRRIGKAFNSIAAMFIPENVKCELIVVDNNSSDGTRELVRKCKKSYELNIKYVFEGKQGLSNARNKGILAATGEYVAFTDDDCIVDRNWIYSIINEFRNDPELAVLGGRVELYDKRDKAITVRTSRDRAMLVSPNQLFTLLPGCNMAFKREVFNVVGRFDSDLGAGTRTHSAEDSDYFYRAFKKGFKILYSPEVLVYHDHGRRTDSQVMILQKGYVIGRGAFYCKHILGRDGQILKLSCRELYRRARKAAKDLIERKSIRKDLYFVYFLALGAAYRLTRRERKDTNQTG